jgi:glycosyltransferase involved in cell wall biosynthesis
MTSKPFSLSVVVPVYNEQDALEPFFAATAPVLQAITPYWEMLFVNDGSRDGTLAGLRALAQRDSRVKFISFSRNFGKEPALTAGLDHASGDAVVPIDVDLQDPPALIADMVRLWREDGVDVVYGTRLRRDGETWLKKLTALVFYRLMRRISPVDMPANTGDFRLLDRRVVDELRKLRERNRFMKGLFAWVGFRQVSLPFVRAPRSAGKTKFNFWRLWNFAIEGMTSFSHAPLQAAMYLGFLVSLVSFVYGAFIIGKVLIYGRDMPGYASIMVAVLFFGGVQLMALGVIGEYVGRIYDEVKQRPLYLIAESSGIEPKRS